MNIVSGDAQTPAEILVWGLAPFRVAMPVGVGKLKGVTALKVDVAAEDGYVGVTQKIQRRESILTPKSDVSNPEHFERDATGLQELIKAFCRCHGAPGTNSRWLIAHLHP